MLTSALFITSKIFFTTGRLSCSLRALRMAARSCQKTVSAKGPGPWRKTKRWSQDITVYVFNGFFYQVISLGADREFISWWYFIHFSSNFYPKSFTWRLCSSAVVKPNWLWLKLGIQDESQTWGFLFSCSSMTMVIWVCQFITHCSNFSTTSGLESSTSTSGSRSSSGMCSVTSVTESMIFRLYCSLLNKP